MAFVLQALKTVLGKGGLSCSPSRALFAMPPTLPTLPILPTLSDPNAHLSACALARTFLTERP